MRRLGEQDFLDAGHFRGGLRRFRALLARNEHRDVAAHFCRGRHRIGDTRLQFRAVMFGNDQDCHLNDPRFVS